MKKNKVSDLIKEDDTASLLTEDLQRVETLYHQTRLYIEVARREVSRTVDQEMLKAYWLIGRDLIEDEQQGETRADYGKKVLKTLAVKLSREFGRGFGVDTLERTRKFYISYSTGIYRLRDQEKSAALLRKSEPPIFKANLTWTHYLLLLKIDRKEARAFYEIEASKNNWSSRELERQIGSLLFDRLAKSKDKQGLLELASEGQEINVPKDIIKDPLVLEFLGVPEAHQLSETKLEEALISNLKHFLLELGKGFAFVGRQKRISLDGSHFYTDLVFYHVILKCYIIIDLKVKPITHGDLGQMLFYVNYYDEEIKAKEDNPTIGLILCTEKTDKMVKYTLGEKAKQIFASKYQFHLPTEEELEKELKKEITEIKHRLEDLES